MTTNRLATFTVAMMLLGLAAGPATADDCAAVKLKAVGKLQSSLLKCDAKVASKNDSTGLAVCQDKAFAKFATAFAKSGTCDGLEATCESTSTSCENAVVAAMTDTLPSKCESSKRKAAGKLAASELGCYSKAAKGDVAVDPECLSKARTKYSDAIAKAGSCPDGGAPQVLVEDNCVAPALTLDGSDLVTDACPVSTTTTTTGMTTTTLDAEGCSPGSPNGTPCNDGDACTTVDTCQMGVCNGSMPVLCSPQDQCHNAGTCDPMSGVCSNPSKADNSPCNDGDLCTTTDTCQSGTCSGAMPVLCSPLDQCHNAGTCNPLSGVCSNPAKPDLTACDDDDVCTTVDRCQSGTCTGSSPVTCTALDECHVAGTCDAETGCSNPPAPVFTSCSIGGGTMCDGAGNCVNPPAVTGTTPSDSTSSVASTTLSVTFDSAMNAATLSGQASAGACSGTIQVSKDDFTSCVAFSSATPTMSGGNTTATFTAAPGLLVNRTFKIRVTTAATSASGVPIASQFTTANGFTTISPDTCAGKVVISVAFGGGGSNAGGPNADYVELHNRGASAVNLTGWSVQAGSGLTWTPVPLTGTIAAGGYFLVQMQTSQPTGVALSPDVSGGAPLPANNGKVALVNTTTALSGTCPSGSQIMDELGWGSSSSCAEGGAAGDASSSTAVRRNQNGCSDTEVNGSDFTIGSSAGSRNSASSPVSCGCTVANESGAALEADYCNVQFPTSLSLQTGTNSGQIFGQIYEAGFTEAAGANTSITAQVGYGATTSNPEYETWTWARTNWNTQASNNDEYWGIFTAPAVGSYKYAYRFSRDGGVTWTVCDIGGDAGAGSLPGLTLELADLPNLTVTP